MPNKKPKQKRICPLCKQEIKTTQATGFGSEPKEKCACKPPWSLSNGTKGWCA